MKINTLLSAMGGLVLFSSGADGQFKPNDPLVSAQWHFDTIRAERAWRLQTGCENLKIAVIDTGIDSGHQDLAPNLDGAGYDFVNDRSGAPDDNGHGTFVAGLIGAVGNNGLGITGMCWRARMTSLKILRADGSGFLSDAADALVYAGDNGFKITNNSYGGGFSAGQIWPGFLISAVDYAGARGVLNIFAAGNSNIDMNSLIAPETVSIVRSRVRGRVVNRRVVKAGSRPIIPASVILVGATTSADERASFSNYGSQVVDFGAPGQNVVSTQRGNTYGAMSGTSFSAPIVAGAAALLWSRFLNWNMAQVKAGVLALSVNPTFSTSRIESGFDVTTVKEQIGRSRFFRNRVVSTPYTRTIIETRTPLNGLFRNQAGPNQQGARIDFGGF